MNPKRRERTMTMMIIGIDLGKTVCSLAGLDEGGRVVFRKRVRRDRLSGFLANLPPSTVAMEACCGAHHAAREALALGHEARLMPPEYVRPYVKPNFRSAFEDMLVHQRF